MLVLAIATLAFILPFTEGGVCITLLLTRLPYGGGWLYAADLSGAALGCLGIIFVLLVIDPVSAALWIGAFAAGAGWIVARDSGDVRSLRLSGAVALALAAAAACIPGLTLPAKAISASSGPRGSSRRDAVRALEHLFARRVTALGETAPFGWGFAHTPTDEDRPGLSRHRRRCEHGHHPAGWRYRQALLPEGRRHQRGLFGAAARRRRGRWRRRRPRHSFGPAFRRQAHPRH